MINSDCGLFQYCNEPSDSMKAGGTDGYAIRPPQADHLLGLTATVNWEPLMAS
jgi:hypothetical protein